MLFRSRNRQVASG